jgi:hypothetical protein
MYPRIWIVAPQGAPFVFPRLIHDHAFRISGLLQVLVLLDHLRGPLLHLGTLANFLAYRARSRRPANIRLIHAKFRSPNAFPTPRPFKVEKVVYADLVHQYYALHMLALSSAQILYLEHFLVLGKPESRKSKIDEELVENIGCLWIKNRISQVVCSFGKRTFSHEYLVEKSKVGSFIPI